jgi:hypothetical protein
MAYNEIITGLQVNTGWNLTFNPTGKFPVIAKRAFPTLADAQAYVDDVNSSATLGVILTVTQDTVAKNNGIYLVTKVAGVDGATVGELTPAGSGAGSEAVNTYADAIALATSDNIGQLIYVKTTTYKKGDGYTATEGEADKNEAGEPIEFTAGPYVVTGAGSVAKLGTTSASGDIAGDVETLKGDVATLKDESVKGIIIDGSVQAFGEDKNVTLDLGAYAKNADLVDPLSKLDGIEEGAQVNIIESVKVAGSTLEVTDKGVSIVFDASYDASTSSENAIQHKVIAAVIEDLRGKISEIPKFRIEVVEELPETGELAVVYLKKQTGEETKNLYEEYVWTGSVFELLGRQELDLTDYITSGELATELEPYAKTADVSTALESYALKADYTDSSTLAGLLDEKVDVLEGHSLISDASILIIGQNAEAIEGLKSADASLQERVLALEEDSIFDVVIDPSTSMLGASVADNTLTLSLTIGDLTTGADGLVTVGDVKSFVATSIESALDWQEA